MPIRRYLQSGAVFTPEALSAMNEALTDTAEILGIGSDEKERQAVARFIIRVASEDGSLDAAALTQATVAALGGVAYSSIPANPQPSGVAK